MRSFEENMLCCWRNWFSQTVFDIEWKNCAWMAKTFRQSCENCVFSVCRIILRRNIYSESVFVFFFAFFVSRERFQENFLFSEKNNFLMFCDSERKNFGLKQENFFCRIAKTTIEVSVGTFSGIFSNIFSSFFIFRQGHRNLHSRCQNDHFEEFVFDFFFIIFGHWAENQLLLVEKLWQCCYICVLRVQKDILTKISFSSRNCFLEHFWTRDKFTPVFWQKLFDNVVKTSFSVSIGNFRGIKCLKKKSFFFSRSRTGSKKTFGPWRSYFGKVVKTAIYVSKEIVLGDFFLPKKRKFFECFVTMSEKPSASGKNFFCCWDVKTAN